VVLTGGRKWANPESRGMNVGLAALESQRVFFLKANLLASYR
jgi:hypothetical protein